MIRVGGVRVAQAGAGLGAGGCVLWGCLVDDLGLGHGPARMFRPQRCHRRGHDAQVLLLPPDRDREPFRVSGAQIVGRRMRDRGEVLDPHHTARVGVGERCGCRPPAPVARASAHVVDRPDSHTRTIRDTPGRFKAPGAPGPGPRPYRPCLTVAACYLSRCWDPQVTPGPSDAAGPRNGTAEHCGTARGNERGHRRRMAPDLHLRLGPRAPVGAQEHDVNKRCSPK